MPLIVLNGMGRRYELGDNPIHALHDVSLTIDSGESVAIMGPSGSGKSTLLGIIGCFDQATAGTYRLAGEEVGQMKRDQLALIRSRRVGFVFQRFNLLPRLTALENVELPLAYARIRSGARRRRALEMLERLGLGDRLHHLPNQLSGGQQQRVAIARALVNNPDLILADEPTGALDSRTGEEILELLERVNAEGTTLVIVTHDANIAARTRRVIVLEDGRIQTDTSLSGTVQQAELRFERDLHTGNIHACQRLRLIFAAKVAGATTMKSPTRIARP